MGRETLEQRHLSCVSVCIGGRKQPTIDRGQRLPIIASWSSSFSPCRSILLLIEIKGFSCEHTDHSLPRRAGKSWRTPYARATTQQHRQGRAAGACRGRLVDCRTRQGPRAPDRRGRGPGPRGTHCRHRHGQCRGVRHLRCMVAGTTRPRLQRARTGPRRFGITAALPRSSRRGASRQPRPRRCPTEREQGAAGARGPRACGCRHGPRSHRLRRHAGRTGACAPGCAAAPAEPAAHLRRASSRPRRLAGRADHPADHLPDRRHHRPAGHSSISASSAPTTTSSTWSASWCCARSAC